MDLLTFYSESHKVMYENYFLESYQRHLKNSFILKAKEITQLSKTGDYDSTGFNETMLEKIKFVLENFDSSDEPFVFADCDIQFFGDFKESLLEELGDHDIAFQDDIVCRCAGFFIAKRNKKVRKFMELVLETTPKFDHDQTAMNHILNNQHRFNLNLKEKRLPKNKYFTVAAATNAKQWSGQDFDVPKGVLVHHSNWTVGLDNKINLLELVRKQLDQ